MQREKWTGGFDNDCMDLNDYFFIQELSTKLKDKEAQY